MTKSHNHSNPHLKVRPHEQKFSRTTWYNMVVRHKTCRGSVDGMGDMCHAMRHFMLCDQDREPPNVGPLQKKFSPGNHKRYP